jgi:SAM-dependent methyltransferase
VINTTTSCPLCASNEIKNQVIVGNNFKVWNCGGCRFTWVDRDDLSRPEAAPSYDSYDYSKGLRRAFEQMQTLYLKGFEQRLKRTLGPRSLKNSAFLDVGCANGEYLWTCKSLGFGLVSGVEIDSEAARHASRYGEVADDVSKLSHSTYDIIQIKNVLSNIPDFLGFLNTYRSLLKPNGFLFIDVLNQYSLTAVLRNTLIKQSEKTCRYGPLRPPYVVNGFSKSALKTLLLTQGYSLTHLSSSYMGSPQVPYAPNRIAGLLGLVGSWMGRGSMLIAEAKRVP